MAGFIANSGCTLLCDNPTAQATIMSPPDTKVMVGNMPAYAGVLNIQVMGATQGAFAQTAPMVTTLSGTGAKVMIGNMPAVLMGDKSVPAMCVLVGPNGATMTLPVTVTILDAGQTKVQA